MAERGGLETLGQWGSWSLVAVGMFSFFSIHPDYENFLMFIGVLERL